MDGVALPATDDPKPDTAPSAVRRKAGITATVDALAWQVQEQTDELAAAKLDLERQRTRSDDAWRLAYASEKQRADLLLELFRKGLVVGQSVAS